LIEDNAKVHYHRPGIRKESNQMTTLTVTARGQVTFRKEVLQHLGIKPGEKIELALLPNGRAELRAIAPRDPIRALHGLLKGKTNGTVLTIEEMNQAIAEAGAASGSGEADSKP